MKRDLISHGRPLVALASVPIWVAATGGCSSDEGGSANAGAGAIEALEIPADADLTITGDRINPMPEQPDYN